MGNGIYNANLMTEDRIPAYVKTIMKILSDAGGTPYIVGGAVRDLIQGTEPHDYDIACDLLPNQILEVLVDHHIRICGLIGFNFGVVVCVVDGHQVEIATFRGPVEEDESASGLERRNFSNNIEDDLSRRDFTVNAMALDAEGKVIDLYHGMEDLLAKRLRPVGDPSMRYREDAVRMFRACRFVSQFGFTYIEGCDDKPSDVFVRKNFWEECEARHCSRERVRKEMEKLLLSDFPDKGLSLLMSSGLVNCPVAIWHKYSLSFSTPFQSLAHLEGLAQNPMYHKYDVWNHTLQAVHLAPRDIKLRWAMLFHDAGKGLPTVRRIHPDTGMPTDYGHETESVRIVSEALTALGYNDNYIREVSWLVKNHMSLQFVMRADHRQLKRWLRKKISDFRTQKDMAAAFKELEQIFLADLGAGRHSDEEENILRENMAYVRQVIEDQMPVHSSDLAITGDTVMQLIDGTGLEIKNVFAQLLKMVQTGNLANEEEALIACLQKMILRKQNEEQK